MTLPPRTAYHPLLHDRSGMASRRGCGPLWCHPVRAAGDDAGYMRDMWIITEAGLMAVKVTA